MSVQQQKPDPKSAAPDIQIPGYQIKGVLGRGGMATVYLATQDSIGRDVALKVLAPHLGDGTFTDRFLREAHIVSKLTHPHIITVYDVGVHQDHHYMAMEYIRGDNLKQARDRLSRRQKIDIIKQVAKALDYAGKKGYVHRDIKPENIMLHEDGHAVLTDFGLARGDEVSSGLTVTGRAMGTPYYMSPEQTKGNEVDHRSDIYSLGIVLFQVLAGRVPYDGKSVVEVGIKHVSEPIPPLPADLEAFQPVINTCLAKDPARRYKTAGEFLKALEAVSEAELDYIDAKAAALRKAGVDPDANTLIGQAPPASHLKPKAPGRMEMYASEPIAPLEITESNDFQSLKRRDRRILLLPVAIALGIAAYLYGDQLKSLWQDQEAISTPPAKPAQVAEPQAPVIPEKPVTAERPSIADKPAPPKQAVVAAAPTITEKPVSPEKPAAPETIPPQPATPAPATERPQFSRLPPEQLAVTQRLTHRAEELHAGLDAQPTNSEKLAKLYKSWLKQFPGDPNAHRGMDNLRHWLNNNIPIALASRQHGQARMYVNVYKDITPSNERSEQFLAYEQRVVATENLHVHLQKARDYSIAGALVEPEGANALVEYRKALAIDPNNLEAKQALNDIADMYLKQAEELQAASDLPGALTASYKGLAAVRDHAGLLALNTQLKASAEKNELIVEQLLKASEQFKAGNILAPEGESAYDIYKDVLAVNPDHPLGKRGLRLIEQHYVTKVMDAINENNFVQAEAMLDTVQPMFPDSEGLTSARKQLADNSADWSLEPVQRPPKR